MVETESPAGARGMAASECARCSRPRRGPIARNWGAETNPLDLSTTRCRSLEKALRRRRSCAPQVEFYGEPSVRALSAAFSASWLDWTRPLRTAAILGQPEGVRLRTDTVPSVNRLSELRQSAPTSVTVRGTNPTRKWRRADARDGIAKYWQASKAKRRVQARELERGKVGRSS